VTSQRHHQVRAIVRSARELEPADRAALLASACGDDRAWRAEF
jgi:hypothetical protein